jgi:hypothetical protein
MGSNPTQGVNVCVRLFCVCVVLCRVAALRQADPRPRSPIDCVKDQETEIVAKVQERSVEP